MRREQSAGSAVLDDAARIALQARLSRSSFMHFLGGAGYGCISWLLAGGLLMVVLGRTWNESEPNLPPGNTRIIVGGWIYVLAAVVLGAVYLAQLLRFLREVRTWTIAELEHRRHVFTPPTLLEDKLSRLSVSQGMGPGVVLAYGAALVPPCGLVMGPIVLIVLAIIAHDAATGHATLSTLDRIQMGFAALAAIFITAIFVVVMAGFQKAGRRFQRLSS